MALPHGWRLQPNRASTAASGSCGDEGRNIFFNSDVPDIYCKMIWIFTNIINNIIRLSMNNKCYAS
jgi:hypothetical protein